MVPPGTGAWALNGFRASVSADGTLLLPLNMENVLDATQLAFQMGGLRLSFEHDDVVFYNADGVDLTLFTLDVADATQREWGSYYGWNVEQDTGIKGDVYEGKVRASLSMRFLSDILSYWRHEFHTYHKAHQPGGTHEVNADGYHVKLDTLHIDHDHLVLAIRGKERDFWHPGDESRYGDLEPGARTMNVYVATQVSEKPVEPEDMEATLRDAIAAGITKRMVAETASAYARD